MVVVEIKAGEFTVRVETDADPHPDLLDELCSRVRRMFTDTQAGMAEDDEG
jgi:hypothetical protein